MVDIQLGRYYNRFNDDNPQFEDYKSLLFRAGDALQSAEMNEIQETFKRDVNFLARRFLRNGEIISGGRSEVTLEDKGETDAEGRQLYDITATFEEAIMFANGEFVRIEESVVVQPSQYVPESSFIVGAEITWQEITNSEDISLVDPAVETRNYGQPGAGRLKMVGRMIISTEYNELGNNAFLPQYDIIAGEIFNRHKEEGSDPDGFNTFRQDVINIVAKYDRNANGNYLVHGYETAYIGRVPDEDGNTSNLGPFKFSVADGSANVDGYNFEIDVSQEIVLDQLIDFELKQDEPISFNSGDNFYPVRHFPIRKVFRVSGQRQRMGEPVQHGSYIGASDELPNEYQPVRSIDKIYQGSTVYIQGTDYVLVGDSVTWVAGANEPSPSSTYYVDYKYQYTETEGNFSVDPATGKTMGEISDDLKSLYLFSFADGTDVQYDYDFVLQRIDAMFIDATGKIGFVKGVPDENDPRVPDTDPDLTLKIAEILLSGDADPVVTLSSQRVFKMSDIQLLLDSIKQNEYNLTRIALQSNLAENQPGARLQGQFVDSFEDDTMRDLGLDNTAMTIGGNLIMDIDWENVNLDPDIDMKEEQMTIEMPSVKRSTAILSQPHVTKTRLINEYLFKSPPGAKIYINPSVYRWVSKTSYKTFVKQVQVATRGINSWTTRYKVFGTHKWHTVQERETVSKSVTRELLGTSVSRSSSIQHARKPTIIPSITIKIKSNYKAFDGNEPVNIYFDDKLARTVNVDEKGTLNSTFVVPSGILSGSKEVKVVGAQTGISGTTLFRAEPLSRTVQTTVTNWWRWVVRRQGIIWREADPVAQSFVIKETIAIDRISVVFHTLPTTDVSCVLCETSAGFPDKNKALISKTLSPSELEPRGSIQPFIFDNKIVLTKGKEYAFIIICKDAVGRVQVAELGGKTWDLPSIWLTGQAYSVGTLYNSSNNSAWTPLQKEDMRFWIHGCDFVREYEVPYDIFAITSSDYPNGITDMMVLANAKVYEGTSIQYRVELLDRPESASLDNVFLVNSYSQFPLDEGYTGRVRVTAVFKSNGLYTPVLDPNIQLSLGYSHRTSTYTTLGFPIDRNDERVVLYIDNYKPSGTSIAAQLQVLNESTGDYDWLDMTIDPTSTPLGNDWVETRYTFELQSGGTPVIPASQDLARVKLIMSTPNDAVRPVVSNLRLNTQKI